MTLLITYPDHKIPDLWRNRLESWTKVIYLPLTHFHPIMLDSEQYQTIANAQNIGLTSHFAAQLFVKNYRQYNHTATLQVISQKMKAQLKPYVANPIEVSKQENRQSLIDKLKNIDPTSLCWLIGNQLSATVKLPGKVIVIYQNVWNEQLQTQASETLWQQSINQALVTSTSNFKRLMMVQKQLNHQEFQHTQYFVLGKSTGKVITQADLPVIYPTQTTAVLINILSQIEQTIKEEKSL